MNIKNIKYFNYNCINNKYISFYYFQKQFILNIIKNINNTIKISCVNTFEYPIKWNNPSLINKILNSYEEDKETLYIFNSIDYYFFMINLTNNNINIFNKFINCTNYILFHYEVYNNINLDQIGLPINHLLIPNSLINKDRREFIINFYKKSKLSILQSYKNIEYLKYYDIHKNIIYFPCLGYSIINNYIPLKQQIQNKSIDLLFYGTQDINTPHRNNMIKKLVKYTNKNNINFIYNKILYGKEKYEYILKSKIILHLPIKLESKIAPAWCKIMELMCKKIFFIIEENDEIYKANLNNIIVYYKHNDFNDLINKINYYLNNPNKINDVIERCYKLVKEKYNIDKFVKNIIN